MIVQHGSRAKKQRITFKEFKQIVISEDEENDVDN